jgi:hypothetical protein
MKIFACHTPSHADLLAEHFLPSLPAELKCNLVLRALPQEGSGEFDTAGFHATCLRKVEFILESLAKETEPFIFSDVDVRFYGPVGDDLARLLGDADMAFQWDGPRGLECSGFMVLRPSAKLLKFWQGVRDLMVECVILDQDSLHRRLVVDTIKREQDGGDITWDILPERYWTFGSNDKHWTPGQPVNPPADLLMHHANWTVGVENKIALLEAVKAERGDVHLAGSGADETKGEQDRPRRAMVSQSERTMTYSEVTRLMEEQRRRLTVSHRGHPLPLALVLQFFSGDKRRAIELAALLADIEPSRRDDVALVFARQSNCSMDSELQAAQMYVGKKFQVIDMQVDVDESKKYPGVCYDAWSNACEKLSDWYHTGAFAYGNAFFFEADGCPLRPTWIDDIKREHVETLKSGKRVTGPRMRFGGIDSTHHPAGHVNGSFAMHLSCWEDHPSMHRCPPEVAWDIFHGTVLMAEAGPSQIIRNEHGMMGLTENQFHIMAKESAFLVSVKDGTPMHWARRWLVKHG